MFHELRLIGPTKEEIVVQTRKGTDLVNFIAPEPDFREEQVYELLLKKYGQRWIQRKPATGGYNCAGHVWASRRTALPEPQDWLRILEEDGYRLLPKSERPFAGDIVVYVEEPKKEIMHVARIVEIRPGVTEQSPGIPWAISKWDQRAGEAMHAVRDVPFEEQYGPRFRFSTEFWTDRPCQSGG